MSPSHEEMDTAVSGACAAAGRRLPTAPGGLELWTMRTPWSKVHADGVGQAETSGRALQQRASTAIIEIGDLAADVGLGISEEPSRLREAPAWHERVNTRFSFRSLAYCPTSWDNHAETPSLVR